MINNTRPTFYILLGLTDDANWQIVLFLFLFITYIFSILGNLIIITLTLLDSHLKTPMYFFLRNFSLLEIAMTSTCIPRFLFSLATKDNTITYNTCATQLFLYIVFGAAEFFLLAAMSFDLYVAICKPLPYATIMSSKVCSRLVFSSCLSALLEVFPGFNMGLQLDFCAGSVIDHFVCDYGPVLQLSCTDTKHIELFCFTLALVTILVTLMLVFISYIRIIGTILKFSTAQKRKRAFSTCSSHMIVLVIAYGSCIYVYVKPNAQERMDLNKGVAVLTVQLPPLLNPFIYTLRNKQGKQAFIDNKKKNGFFPIKYIPLSAKKNNENS
ncbi:LOW QUALITY PROTEIN: olfactory receptor 6C74-like [Dasypus novemcinctus]|uniref:LOW QUALITY PROTEIN: olfactory receptor 6C74-like n=1 Tax=Dasypus novemcinctus TaxID=9361 RepID=UPI00265FBD28|nr:LOW QUALITY PROTEIN: olfactory receptor 6C74-like [Dasypus novemcinctus]